MNFADGEELAQAALDATAHITEHFPDDQLIACVIMVLLRDDEGELHTHTHTTVVADR